MTASPTVQGVTAEEISAALLSRARDDEGEFEPLIDLLGFSGENKARTVMRAALQAADQVRAEQDGEVESLTRELDELEDDVRSYSNWCVERENEGFRRGEEAGREDMQSVATTLQTKLAAALALVTQTAEANERLREVLRKCRPFVAHHDQNAIVGSVKPLLTEIDAALLSDLKTDTAGAGAGELKAGFVHAVGWDEIDGQRTFRAIVTYPSGPPDLPMSIVWNKTPVAIRALAAEKGGRDE